MVNAGDKTLTFLSAVSRMTHNENQECDNLVRTSQCNSACERKLSERGIHVILISFRHQNDVNAILRKDLNTSTILRGDMDNCKRSKEDKYSCWIGKPILSR